MWFDSPRSGTGDFGVGNLLFCVREKGRSLCRVLTRFEIGLQEFGKCFGSVGFNCSARIDIGIVGP